MREVAEFQNLRGDAILVVEVEGGFEVRRNDANNHGLLDARGAMRAMAFYAHTESSEGEAFVVSASTGCTCCANENFVEGPWRHKESAEAAAAAHLARKTLASQYAPSGRYEVMPVRYKTMPPLGGVLLGDHYFVAEGFVESRPEGQRYPDRLDDSVLS